jgi:hypothetical protein
MWVEPPSSSFITERFICRLFPLDVVSGVIPIPTLSELSIVIAVASLEFDIPVMPSLKQEHLSMLSS